MGAVAVTVKAQVLDVGELSSQHHSRMGHRAANKAKEEEFRVNSEQWLVTRDLETSTWESQS